MKSVNNHRESIANALKKEPLWIERSDTRIKLLEEGEGSRKNCLYGLQGDLGDRAVYEYFAQNDLKGMRYWSAVSTKVNILYQHIIPADDYLSELMLWPVLSDNEELIDWWRQNEAPYQQKAYRSELREVDVPTNYMFYRYQIWLALNGRWEELARRCETILGMKDKIRKDRSYLIDHEFYLALARGEKGRMEDILDEKCLEKNRRIRVWQQSAVISRFIDSYATMFAKLAWRSGYCVETQTPWIPRDWLPVEKNPPYEDPPWEFLRSFDIWQPFGEPWSRFSPVRKVDV